MSRLSQAVIPKHPLDRDDVVKFALGKTISQALDASGKYHLLVSAPSDSTTPEALRGRRIMHAVVVTKEQADELYGIAKGSHRAVRVKTPAPAADGGRTTAP